jgi:hypothetical protein
LFSPALSLGYKTELGYYDTAAQDHWVNRTVTAPATQAMSSGQWKPLATAYDEAVATANYVIVTNPKKLEWAIVPWQPSAFNDLLSDMAWLARERQGVVAYMDAYNGDLLRSLIEPGGGWAKRLAPKFSTTLGGYVLIVGESEIVPAWTVFGNSVEYSDQPYAGDTPPERIVGRIIGNTHTAMSNAIRNSLGVELNWPGYDYDRSHAFLVSGTDGTNDGVDKYKDCINDIDTIVDKRGIVPDTVHLHDLAATARVSAFKSGAPGNDIIVFRDHGLPDCWCPVGTDDLPAWPILDLGTIKPFALSLSCLAGCYENHRAKGGGDYNIAEAFFDRGVAVYIGATEVTARSANNAAGRWFFKNWDPSESIGKVLADLESAPYASAVWAAQYNIYGDPKFGAISSTLAIELAPPVLAAPAGSFDVVVPDYEISHHNGTDYVSFPEGYLLLDEGEPEIPYHRVALDYPAGTRVQAVTLTDRSDLSVATGLNLPITSMAPDCVQTERPLASTTDAWLPSEDFEWHLIDNPDGTTTLEIAIFAFRYHPLTTDVRFYKNYSFEIETTPSTVAITRLTTDRHEYEPGTPAIVDLEIANAGEPQDVVVEAVVTHYGSGEVVDGLLLTTLTGLQGDASFANDFDTGGVDPDYYMVDITLRDTVGNTLDRETALFRVGTVSGELTTLTAIPGLFRPGDSVHTALEFANTGAVPITATAVIAILDESGATVETFTHQIVDLAPGATADVSNIWDTTGTDDGMYEVVGLVHYDSRTTDTWVTRIGTRAYIYLPLVLRDG